MLKFFAFLLRFALSTFFFGQRQKTPKYQTTPRGCSMWTVVEGRRNEEEAFFLLCIMCIIVVIIIMAGFVCQTWLARPKTVALFRLRNPHKTRMEKKMKPTHTQTINRKIQKL